MILRTKISKKMKITGAALLGFLLLFLLFCGLSENQDWIARHFQVKVPVNNRWQELDIHLMHSNENNRLSDGVTTKEPRPMYSVFTSIGDIPSAVTVPLMSAASPC